MDVRARRHRAAAIFETGLDGRGPPLRLLAPPPLLLDAPPVNYMDVAVERSERAHCVAVRLYAFCLSGRNPYAR